MSIPYSTAVGLIYGKAGLQEFAEDVVKDPEVIALTKKVSVTSDDELSALFPGIQAAVVSIKTKDGEYTERVDFPKGEPENPLTDKEFRDRYFGLMDYAGVDGNVSADVFDAVYEDDKKVDDLIRKL